MNYDVVTIGAADVDIFIKSDSFISTRRHLKFLQSSKNELTDFLICSGGGATNAVTTFARLKLITAPICLIGDDPLSSYVLSDLKNEKIDTNLLVQEMSSATDFSVVIVSKNGHRSVFTNRGPTSLNVSSIPWEKIKNSKWLYITSLEGNLDLLEQIIGFASEHNIKIALNPGSRELKNHRLIHTLASHADFLLLNREEAEIYADIPFSSSSFWPYYEKEPVNTAITNGRFGAHLFTEGQHLYSPIINTTPVDETGAGDAFGSALVAALIYDLSFEIALSWAIKNSASVVSYLGAKKGILTLGQIKK